MDRKPLIMGNWKMNLSFAESLKLARAIQRRRKQIRDDCELVIFPSFTALDAVRRVFEGAKVFLGAQDMFWADRGNFTGEISPQQLRELGCTWILIGHSERREYLSETDDMVGRKVSAALRYGLTPVVCVGETSDQRAEERSELAVQSQIREAFRYVHPPFPGQRIIVAYEPLWTISPGRPCNPDDATAMAQIIRQALIDQYDADHLVENFTIVYGGSVDASNLSLYLAGHELEGALIGNASLNPDTFFPILDAASAFVKPDSPFKKARRIIPNTKKAKSIR